jgi:hypothetical protein
MWVRTSADKLALYNLSAFEVVLVRPDLESEKWSVQATDRNGEQGVMLAETNDREASEMRGGMRVPTTSTSPSPWSFARHPSSDTSPGTPSGVRS